MLKFLNQLIQLQSLQANCQIHPSRQILYASLSSDLQHSQKGTLVCQSCIEEQDIQTTSYLSVSEILRDDSKPIENWPLGIQKDQTDYLTKFSSNNPQIMKELLKTILIDFYSEFEKQLIKSLQQSKEKQLRLLEENQNQENDLIGFYNERFKRHELVKLFSNMQTFNRQHYQELVNEVEKTKKQDLVKLTNLIKLSEKMNDSINSLGNSQKMQSQIIHDLISKIERINTPEQKTEDGISILSQLFPQSYPQNYTNINYQPIIFGTGKSPFLNIENRLSDDNDNPDIPEREKNQNVTRINSNVEGDNKDESEVIENSTVDGCLSPQIELTSSKLNMKFESLNNRRYTELHPNRQNQIEFCHKGIVGGLSQLLTKSPFKKDKCYTIRVLYSTVPSQLFGINLGLIQKGEKKQLSLSDYDILFGGFSSSLAGWSALKKESCLNDITHYEIKIDLENELVQVADFPKYEKVVKYLNPIQKEVDYHFGIALFERQAQQILITHFEESHEFNLGTHDELLEQNNKQSSLNEISPSLLQNTPNSKLENNQNVISGTIFKEKAESSRQIIKPEVTNLDISRDNNDECERTKDTTGQLDLDQSHQIESTNQLHHIKFECLDNKGLTEIHPDCQNQIQVTLGGISSLLTSSHLRSDRCYTIRVSYTQLPSQQLGVNLRYLGLLKKGDEQQLLRHNYKVQFEGFSPFLSDWQTLKKGSQNSDITDYEVRIDLEKGVIQIADFPRYQTVIQFLKPIQKDVKYHFGVSNFSESTTFKVGITYFEESQSFLSFIIS